MKEQIVFWTGLLCMTAGTLLVVTCVLCRCKDNCKNFNRKP